MLWLIYSSNLCYVTHIKWIPISSTQICKSKNSSGNTNISILCQSVLNQRIRISLSNSERWVPKVCKCKFPSVVKLSFVSNNVQDNSCWVICYLTCHHTRLHQQLRELWHGHLLCHFITFFGLLPFVKPAFWHICSSVLHQLLPAVLRNSTAYQHSSNATFYRCIGRGCTQVLQLRKYNRLAIHMSVSRCGGVGDWMVYKQEL